MKNLSQKGLLLFAVMVAVCAFVPSLASAASWSVVGTTHHLFSPNFAFSVSSGPTPTVGWLCVGASFDADVVSANTIEITSGGFQQPCMGTGPGTNCTTTPVGTFPWTVTATATTNVQIHGVDFTVAFENTPGNPTACAILGNQVRFTGTVANGSWNSASNELLLSAAAPSGLTEHYLGTGMTAPVFWSATLRDTFGTLKMFM